MKNNVLKTKRLILRPIMLGDEKEIHEYAGDKDITMMFFLPNDTFEETCDFVKDNAAEWNSPDQTDFEFVIIYEGKIIGGCDADLSHSEDRSYATLGWILNKNYRKMGFASEAADALLDYAFENLNIEKVYAQCDVENPASFNVMKNIGMTCINDKGTRTYPKTGKTSGEYTCMITKEEWMEKKLTALPEEIKKHVAGKSYTLDDMGKSGSKIMVFDDCVLKITDYRKENEDTVNVMRWLEGRIPAPRVICYVKEDDKQYLLMEKIIGKMTCDEYYLEHPKELLDILASALKMLWEVDISDCPRRRDLDVELEEAQYRIDNDLVDVANVEPTTFGEGGFKDPQALLDWLKENKPECEPVLSHGDFCLPNIMVKDGKISGFIDLGDTGIGEKWRDIALCYRSLKHNFDGTFGGKVYPDFNPDMLFDALGIEPDWDKLNYQILLDELF